MWKKNTKMPLWAPFLFLSHGHSRMQNLDPVPLLGEVLDSGFEKVPLPMGKIHARRAGPRLQCECGDWEGGGRFLRSTDESIFGLRFGQHVHTRQPEGA